MQWIPRKDELWTSSLAERDRSARQLPVHYRVEAQVLLVFAIVQELLFKGFVDHVVLQGFKTSKRREY